MARKFVLFAILLVLGCIVFASTPAHAGDSTDDDGGGLTNAGGNGAAANTVIDVMILYTPEAAQAAPEGIQNRINQALAEGNQALQASNIPVTLNLVYSGQYTGIADSVSKDCQVDYWPELMAEQEVQRLRVQHGADLVQLVVRDLAANCWGASLDWGGIAKAERLLAPNYTMIHEFAHSIGESQKPAGIESMHVTADPCAQPRLCSIMGKYPRNSNGVMPFPVRYGRFSEANARYITLGAPSVAQNMKEPCRSNNTLFCDVPESHHAYNEIIEVYNRGITKGCDSSKTPYYDLPFCPSAVVDRAHFATFLVRRIHDNNPNYTPPGPYRGYFSDVPAGHAQALWIEELYERGLTTGATNCAGAGFRFCPDNLVTRQELASFLMRTERYLGNIPDYSSRPIRGYFDDVPRDSVHLRAIESMFEAGYTNGCYSSEDLDTLNFCPEAPVTRATAAMFMARIFRYRNVQALDPLEPDNSYGRASSINAASVAGETGASIILTSGAAIAQQRNLTPITDRDWVRFSLPSSAAVRIETSGAGGDTRLYLYDEQLNEIAYDDDSGTDSFSQIVRTCTNGPLASGSYYLMVDEYGNNGEIPAYTLSMEATETCNTDSALTNIQVAVEDEANNPKALFQRGDAVYLTIQATNTTNAVLSTTWRWTVTDAKGAAVAGMGHSGYAADIEPGSTGLTLRGTAPQTMPDGRYTFTGSVETASGQSMLQASTHFDVAGGAAARPLYLPFVKR